MCDNRQYKLTFQCTVGSTFGEKECVSIYIITTGSNKAILLRRIENHPDMISSTPALCLLDWPTMQHLVSHDKKHLLRSLHSNYASFGKL